MSRSLGGVMGCICDQTTAGAERINMNALIIPRSSLPGDRGREQASPCDCIVFILLTLPTAHTVECLYAC